MQNMHLRENMQIYANLGIMHIFRALIIIIIIVLNVDLFNEKYMNIFIPIN